jgi:ribonuclease HI
LKVSVYSDASIIKRPLTEEVVAIGLGVVVLNEKGQEISAISRGIVAKKGLKKITSNRAEMMGVLEGLREAKELGFSKVAFYNDLESIASVMNVILKNPPSQKVHYPAPFIKIREEALKFKECDFHSVVRKENKRANSLALSAARQVQESLIVQEVKALSKNMQRKLFFELGKNLNLKKYSKEKTRS